MKKITGWLTSQEFGVVYGKVKGREPYTKAWCHTTMRQMEKNNWPFFVMVVETEASSFYFFKLKPHEK